MIAEAFENANEKIQELLREQENKDLEVAEDKEVKDESVSKVEV